MLHFLWMFIVGIVVGALARLIMPGNEHLGLFMTGLLGVAGSFLGGMIGRVFSKPDDGAAFSPAGSRPDATRPASGAGLVGPDRRLSARIFPRQTAGSRHREST